MPNRRGRKGLRGVAARLLRLVDHEGLAEPRVQVGGVLFRLVFDPHQGGGEPRGLPIVRDHQRDRLTVELDRVVVERTERRAFRSHIVVVGRVGAAHLGPVGMREHVEHVFDRQRATCVDLRDAAFGDGRGDDAAIGEVGGFELAGVLRRAGDLGASVDAGGRGADIRCHGAHRIFLLDWTCGVPFAACVKVRTMARRASSILKALCA